MDKERYYIVCSQDFVGNSIVLWRPNSRGYTIHLEDAGKYTKETAQAICQTRDTDKAYPVDVLDKVSRKHVDGQAMYKIRAQQLTTE